MMEDSAPATNLDVTTVTTWLYANPTVTWTSGLDVGVVSVTRKDDSDTLRREQQSRDLIEKYRQGGGGGPPATKTAQGHHNQPSAQDHHSQPSEKAPAQIAEGSNAGNKAVNISLARVVSVKKPRIEEEDSAAG